MSYTTSHILPPLVVSVLSQTLTHWQSREELSNKILLYISSPSQHEGARGNRCATENYDYNIITPGFGVYYFLPNPTHCKET